MPEVNDDGFIHDEVNEVLGRTPVWLVRWGNTLILCIVLLLLATSALVYYPDVITGKATITPTANTVITAPDHETKMQAVYVTQGSIVNQGEVICLLRRVTDPSITDTIVAPFTGVVHLQRIIDTSLSIPAGVSLLALENAAAHHRILIQAPAQIAGKIVLGQSVRISPVQYPHHEYGELEAQIISLPSKEEKGIVTIEASLVNGTTTTRGNKLQLDLTTSGLASIVTSKRTVFERLFAFL
ncbi:MAG: hypothetical protein WCF67_10915 [Chitinophagaceae bacterium]